MEVQWSCAIDENPNSTCDMILGRDLQSALRMDILFSTGTLVWNEISIPMQTGQQREKKHLDEYLDQVIEDLSLPELIREELHEATKILDANYKKADVEEFVKNIPHLTNNQKSQICTLLSNHESLFQGKLGVWDTPPVSLELEEGAKPYHARAYPILHIHEETVQKEVDRLLCIGKELAKDSNSEWAAPTFSIPKEEGTVRFVPDFRQLNKELKRKPFPIPNIQDILQKIVVGLLMPRLPWGKYKFLRLPMGTKNSPYIFQQKISDLREGLEDFIQAYLDDILIITKGSYKDHIQKVAEVLKHLQAAGLQVNLPKSKIAIQELEYLGYWLTPQGIRPMSNKVESNKNLNNSNKILCIA
jgi:hypothetical protein